MTDLPTLMPEASKKLAGGDRNRNAVQGTSGPRIHTHRAPAGARELPPQANIKAAIHDHPSPQEQNPFHPHAGGI